MINELKKAAKAQQNDCRAIDKIGVVSLVLRAEQHAVTNAAKAHGNRVTLIVRVLLGR
jgi:hypothetical protein